MLQHIMTIAVCCEIVVVWLALDTKNTWLGLGSKTTRSSSVLK